MIRTLFMGTPDFAVPSLRALCDNPLIDVVGVVTREDKPAGRGRKLLAPPVKQFAESRDIAVFQPKGVRSEKNQEKLRAFEPELIIVAAYGRILPQEVLDIPPHGCINVHASLLPQHRGASPIAHAILAGDKEAGVSIMKMDAGMDTGPVYQTAAIPMPANATCGSLTEMLAELGAQTLNDALAGILDGSIHPEPQDDDKASYAPLLKKEDGLIDFSRPAAEIERRVRAMSPWPGAFTACGNVRVQIVSAAAVDAQGAAGEVVRATGKSVIVACGEGGLCLGEIKPAGRKIMPATAWAAGRGISQGDILRVEKL